jgi:hypothetical protein
LVRQRFRIRHHRSRARDPFIQGSPRESSLRPLVIRERFAEPQLDYLRIVAVDDAVAAIKQPLAQLIDVGPGVGGKRPSGGREITPPARFGRRPPLLKSTAPVAGRVRGPGRSAAPELVEPDGERHPGKLPIV